MASVSGPDFLALQVRDMANSRRFYTERLGLRVAPQSPPGAIVFQTTPIPFAIREPMVDLDSVQRLGWGVALWIACDDADALATSLEQAGIDLVQRPQDGPFGRQFSVADPDGYVLTIHGKAGSGD
jgi:predicted enzyme related to lactoylglutathione lyase